MITEGRDGEVEAEGVFTVDGKNTTKTDGILPPATHRESFVQSAKGKCNENPPSRCCSHSIFISVCFVYRMMAREKIDFSSFTSLELRISMNKLAMNNKSTGAMESAPSLEPHNSPEAFAINSQSNERRKTNDVWLLPQRQHLLSEDERMQIPQMDVPPTIITR